jgi:RNA polymerase sigma factor (sigma-70 family)
VGQEQSRVTEPVPDLVTDVRVATVEELFDVERDGMVRLAFLLVGDLAQAEEIVQDAFVAVVPRFETLVTPGAYLRVAVVNGCRTAMRRRLRVWPAPATTSATHLATDHVWDVIARLPRRQRVAVVLRFYADLPEAEIAAALDVRPGTVKSLLHRALASLREELRP